MDNIDQELKKVQLARERLALEKELERRELKANTLGAAKGAIGVASGGISVAMDAGRAGWKKAALAVAVSAGVYGVYEMVQAAEKAKSDAKWAEYQAELREFVDRSCGPYKVSDVYVIGLNAFDDKHKLCQLEAKMSFEESRRK